MTLITLSTAGDALLRAASNEYLEAEVVQAAELIAAKSRCDKIIVTGMGKAGIIGRKFAATLSSMGIPAIWIHPGEAQHGDLGMVSECDLIVALSTSGKTYELMEMLTQARRFQTTHLLITANPHAQLSADHYVLLPKVDEVDAAGLVPTTSTTVMLAVCDEIAVRAADQRGYNRQTFAERHHGGYLGELARQEPHADMEYQESADLHKR